MESFATLEAAATKVGVGSGPKQVQGAVLDDSKSPSQPSSLSPSPLSPSSLLPTPTSGSQPHSMLTPSSGFVAADISTSFPRSRSHEYTTSRRQLAPPPKLTASAWEIRRLMIVITIVLLAIATYLLVRPR
jgi:hypothetical protein